MVPVSRLLGLVLVVTAGSATVYAQRLLYEGRGESKFEGLGRAVAIVRDVNRDGFDDYAVGAPGAKNSKGIRTGRVDMFSGKDGGRIYRWFGDSKDDVFGFSVSSGGDINKDGYSDIIVGATRGGTGRKGYARVFSARNGKTLYDLKGDRINDEFGYSVAFAGDVNKDGYGDLVVGAPERGARPSSPGYVRVFSGRDGSTIHTFRGAHDIADLGTSVAGAGDVDGFHDVLAGAPGESSPPYGVNGHVYLFSGRYGVVLSRLRGDANFGRVGHALSVAGDVDKDGIPEVILWWPRQGKGQNLIGGVRVYSGGKLGRPPLYSWVSGPNETLGAAGSCVSGAGDVDGDGVPDFVVGLARGGIGRLYSGKNGRVLYTFLEGFPASFSVAGGGDINKDGYGDVIVGNPWTGPCCRWGPGRVWVFSGLTALRASRNSLSLSKTGGQGLFLDAGTRNAGKPYLLVGSMSGTHPGLRLGPVILPLKPDPYLLLSVSIANSAPLIASLGFLDSRGKALSLFVMVPGLPRSLAGVTLNHAFVVFGVGGFEFASNAVPLKLVK